MLQENDIQRRLHLLVQAIGQAAHACSAERSIPAELRDSMQRLDRHADMAREVLLSGDDLRIRKMMLDMERLAERARQVCVNVSYLSVQLRSAVSYMHGQVMELKRDMHVNS